MKKILSIYLLFFSIILYGQKVEITVDTTYIVKAIDEINSSFDESYVIPLGDSILWIASNRGEKGIPPKFTANSNYESAFVSQQEVVNEWTEPDHLSFEDNAKDIFLAGYSTDSNWFLVYDGSLHKGDLLVAQKRKNRPIRPKLLSLDFKSSRETSGFIDIERRKMYFTSDRKEGIGGLDIWVADIDSVFHCSNIKNLGPTINTPAHEHSIWIRNDTMWFASQGHNSLGGFDIFYTVRSDSTWTEPQSIGDIINTSADDISYSPVSNTWCSTRNGEDYDIFKYTLKIDTTKTLLSKEKEEDLIFEDTQSVVIVLPEPIIQIDLPDKVISNIDSIRVQIGEEIEYCMVQLITYERDGPNAVSPQDFAQRWNITTYPIDTSHRVVSDGRQAVAYLLDRKFYDQDHQGIERAVAYKREFVSQYPAFDYVKNSFKPFVNVYTQSGKRKLIFFDADQQRYYIFTE